MADRNILASQAFTDFTAFPDDALIRIEPKEIKKQGKVPKNGSLFFTIFQTFMTKKGDKSTANFYDYPPDFFDIVIIDIKLADGKERELEDVQKTTFWNADGKPISAEEFIQQLFGDIPELFKDETELRALWSRPDTRKSLLTGLTEKGYGDKQLMAIAKITNTEKSDIFDVLTYIAYAIKPLTRQERVIKHQNLIFSKYTGKQQEFLDFVLNQYIQEGVGELDRQKLPQLLELKYQSMNDAIKILGKTQIISEIFTNFQAYLYSDKVVS